MALKSLYLNNGFDDSERETILTNVFRKYRVKTPSLNISVPFILFLRSPSHTFPKARSLSLIFFLSKTALFLLVFFSSVPISSEDSANVFYLHSSPCRSSLHFFVSLPVSLSVGPVTLSLSLPFSFFLFLCLHHQVSGDLIVAIIRFLEV